MAKIRLAQSTFSLVPEGTTTFKVVEVDDSKYDDFGKIEVKLQTKDGKKHSERFSLIDNNGELVEGALKAWSYLARVCLNNFSADEIDTQDIVGCYITATVKHETYVRTKGEKKGTEATTVRLNDYAVATGFASATNDKVDDDDDEIDDLDEFLDDED